MKNRRRCATSLGALIQPAPFDHDLFRHLYVTRDGADVIDLASGDPRSEEARRVVEAIFSQHFCSREYILERATNRAFVHLTDGLGSHGTVLKEIESREPHIWFVSQNTDHHLHGHTFASPNDLFTLLKEKGLKPPRRRSRRRPSHVDSAVELSPATKWIDIQTRGDPRIAQEVLARFPMDTETEDACLFPLGQDTINTTHTSLGGERGYVFINLIGTPTVTAQTVNLCHSGEPVTNTDPMSSQRLSDDTLCRGKSVMEMRFNAMHNNISRSAVPDPIPVALLAFQDWVITVHHAPFAEMDDLLRMLQVYCSHGEEIHAIGLNIMTHQRFTTALFVTTFLRISVGHNIDSAALAEAVNELEEVVFDVPENSKEQQQIIRRITDTRRCFGECGTDLNRREHMVDTLLDNELENNFITRDPVNKNVLEMLRAHLRYAQNELADYRDTVAVSNWYHNVAVQRSILIRGNGDLRMNLLLTEMCNIMYPVMLIQTLYSMNVVVPFDSDADPPNDSLVPFFVTAAFFAIYIFWFGRAVFQVFRKKVFISQFVV